MSSSKKSFTEYKWKVRIYIYHGDNLFYYISTHLPHPLFHKIFFSRYNICHHSQQTESIQASLQGNHIISLCHHILIKLNQCFFQTMIGMLEHIR